MRTANPTSNLSSNWGHDIWSSRPNGAAARNNSDSGRTQLRPPPLARPGQPASDARDNDEYALENSERITGSGSLLSSSESEPFSRNRWTSMGTISAPMTGARSMEPSVSPALQRSAQLPRSSSPFFPTHQGAIGQGPTPRSSQSLLDPTTRSFDFPASANLYTPYSQNGSQSAHDSQGSRAGPGASPFGGMNSNGSQSYSAHSSRAASRNGSLPPSRHGDFPSQLDDFSSQFHAHASDAFGHRPNQPSRNSTFSNNSNGRPAEHAWQSQLNDLPAAFKQMGFGRGSADVSESEFYESVPQFQPNGLNGSVNGRSNGFFGAQRTPSASSETETTLNPGTYNPSNLRVPFPFQPSSPAHSRQGHSGSQVFANDALALGPQIYGNGHSQPLPSPGHSDERKLQRVQQQQAHDLLQAHAAQHARPPFNAAYGFDPDMHRANAQLQYYANLQPGYGSQVPPLPFMPPQWFQRTPPRGPSREAGQEKLRSPLLEEFKDKTSTRRWELKDIYGHVVEFIGDQNGSRFIQGKLESANSDEKAQLFAEIFPNCLQLMMDVFGNYVVQKFFENGTQTQKKQLADKMKGQIPELSVNSYGCRVVQKAFEHILVEQQASLVRELDGHVQKCVEDQHGNHVIQKAIQRIPFEHIQFIIDSFTHQVQHLATHPYGCRVVQRMLEHCPDPVRANVLADLHACAKTLIPDQYGNYVVQHVLASGDAAHQEQLHAVVRGHFLTYSRHKFASNVVERAIINGSREQQLQILRLVFPPGDEKQGDVTVQTLTRDPYGNYVIQKLLTIIPPPERDGLADAVRRILPTVRPVTKERQFQEIDRLVNFGPAATLSSSRHRPSPPHGLSPRAPSHGPPHRPHYHNVHHPHDHHSHDRHAPHPHPPGPPHLDLSTAPTPPLVSEDTQSPQSSSQPSTTSSTMDGPVAGAGGAAAVHAGAVGKAEHVVRIEVAEDDTLTVPAATTPKAA